MAHQPHSGGNYGYLALARLGPAMRKPESLHALLADNLEGNNKVDRISRSLTLDFHYLRGEIHNFTGILF